MISDVLSLAFRLIYLLLIVYILLSWFPNVSWQKQPFYAIKSFADIFLLPFRRLIPPIGMVDISPIVAFICLSFIANFLIQFLRGMGL